MSEEHIDPREVRVIEEKINPDEVKVYGGGFFGPKRSDWNRMRAMFSGEDPYAAAASPENRQQLEASVNLMPDPDAELRKIAVTAYMSRMKRENVSFVYDNLDKILETYYGQKTSVDEAFKDIGGMLLNGRGDDGSGTGNEIFLAVGSGLAGAADFALSIGKFLARYAVPHDVTKENPFENLLKRAKEPVSDYHAVRGSENQDHCGSMESRGDRRKPCQAHCGRRTGAGLAARNGVFDGRLRAVSYGRSFYGR